MALTWQSKAPTEIVERRWTVPIAQDDDLSAVSTSASGVTVDDTDIDGNDAVVTLSGGSAGVPALVTVTVTTTAGLTLVETFLFNIEPTANEFAYTAQDICSFALRKIIGNGETADGVELADALERLNDMLAMWRIDGLDVGAPLPMVSSTVIKIADEYILAIKWNLRFLCESQYGEPEAMTARMAEDSKRLVANALFTVPTLTMPRLLRHPTPMTSIDDI